MGSLGVSSLLGAWEDGQALNPVRRALLLLHSAWPEFDRDDWSRLPVGVRDRWLVDLRVGLFGTRFEVLADCPSCGSALEVAFSEGDFPAPSSVGEAVHALEWRGHHVRYRLPTSEDLLAVLEECGAADPADRLLERCVEVVSRGGSAVPVEDLAPDLRAAIERAMAERDRDAEIDLAILCRECGHGFESRFDIVEHLWGEVNDWAERLLAEVHVLARAYGWNEETVLRLSPARRRHYLGLVSA